MATFTVYETVTLIRHIEADSEDQARAIVMEKSVADFDEVDCSPSASGPDKIRVVREDE